MLEEPSIDGCKAKYALTPATTTTIAPVALIFRKRLRELLELANDDTPIDTPQSFHISLRERGALLHNYNENVNLKETIQSVNLSLRRIHA